MSFFRSADPCIVLSALVASSAFAMTAQAAPPLTARVATTSQTTTTVATAPTVHHDRVTTTHSASTHPTQTQVVTTTPNYSTGSTQWGLGVWSSDAITVGDTLSALIASGDNWIQPFFSVAGTAGAFEFNLGASYRITVAGSAKSGFHIAPGVALGSVNAGGSKFAFSVFGLAGGHYAVFDRMILAFDAGPILSSIDGNLDFKVRPAGSLLGLSIHYLF